MHLRVLYDWEKTAIIFLYKIYLIIIIIQKECVYCVVGHEGLSVTLCKSLND
jgi:hypothetical protein